MIRRRLKDSNIVWVRNKIMGVGYEDDPLMGSEMRKVVPLCWLLSTVIDPPWASMIDRDMLSPRPNPALLRDLST